MALDLIALPATIPVIIDSFHTEPSPSVDLQAIGSNPLVARDRSEGRGGQ